ncbi:MAG: sulfite exporter TauE/SafE family protein [Pseudomonadales bacterium]|nr:sulfite exporter TauE/SafE family protein [Pseudomonadales bacterium]
MLYAGILTTVFFTSLLSGILGMAGGIILMAILLSVLSVSSAMVAHGLVQATANGSRAFFLRKQIQWSVLPAYIVGACIATAIFVSLTLVPNVSWILICIGLFPWIARLLPKSRGLNITHNPASISAGIIVTSAQLFAGVSGPLLDMFYLNTQLTRHQIIATKALTQTLGHILKSVYYTLIIQQTDSLPLGILLAAMISAVLGTRVGTHIVDKLSERQFRRASEYLILSIGTLCLLKGIAGLIEQPQA